MITIGMNYHVIEGKEEEFMNGFNGVEKALSKVNGHNHSYLFRDCKNNNKFMIISEWNDQDVFDEFVSSEGFKNITNWARREILLSRPTHKIF